MKTIHADYCVTVAPNLMPEIRETSHYGTLHCAYVKEFIRDLRFVVLLNEDALGVHTGEVEEVTCVDDTLERYDVRIAWGVEEAVDEKSFKSKMLEWLVKCHSMWTRDIDKVEGIE